jgi:predicted nucleic acid-binding Zn finger protein
MTAKELQKRNERAQHLKVLQAEEGNFYVESSEGKILYKVVISDDKEFCSCGDYARNVKVDPNFRCKHLLAVQNCVPNGEVEQAEFLEKRKPKLDDRFITTIQGKEFVIYAGLLDLAHQKGLLKLEVQSIQYPTKENGNEAICRAIAESKIGEIFSDIGDANPGNCHQMIAKHIIRMASTRAKARALRDMTNIGMTCLEELGDFDEVLGAEVSKKAQPRKTGRKTGVKPTEPETGNEQRAVKEEEPKEDTGTPTQPQPDESGQGIIPKMSEAQRRAVYNLSRRRGISVDELENMVRESYGVNLEALSSSDASTFIRQLQQSA